MPARYRIKLVGAELKEIMKVKDSPYIEDIVQDSVNITTDRKLAMEFSKVSLDWNLKWLNAYGKFYESEPVLTCIQGGKPS